jgi:hypothetical protein
MANLMNSGDGVSAFTIQRAIDQIAIENKAKF